MAENKREDSKKSNKPQTQLPPQISVNAQYIKDLSFENPKSPAGFTLKEKPQIDVNVDIKASGIAENTFEVTLGLQATSKSGNETLFIAELAYAGIFTLQGVMDQDKEPTLLIFCPNLLFPFARRILADVTRDGGFPSLMLDPIDFARLYTTKKGTKIN